MTGIAREDFSKALLALLEETFQGPSGIYLDADAGLFHTLDTVTAGAASLAPSAGARTIAAHCAHLAYYLRANHDSMLEREQPLDWPSSWHPQHVGDQEWEDLKRRLRREYDALLDTVGGIETWSAYRMGDAMAIVAHTAYHLGAVRHILRNPSGPPFPDPQAPHREHQ